jgi:hypothetical protein
MAYDPGAGARMHYVVPLDAHEGGFRCGYCGQEFTSESGFALCPMGQLRDARVRVLAPAGHPLHGARGTVVMTWSRLELIRQGRRTELMTAPFTWPDGQVIVKLDTRPAVPDQDDPGWLWPPEITVRPGEVELPSGEPLRCGHPVLDGDECDWCHQCPGCCACAAMRAGILGTGEYRGG